jgi:hypothetical protein
VNRTMDARETDLEGKVATADVWKILKLGSYGRTMDDQMRLTALMRLLGWDRRLLRFRAGEVRRGFVRGGDPRTIYVFICPMTGETTVAHDPPSAALGAPPSSAAMPSQMSRA